jgi:hypothetical protein
MLASASFVAYVVRAIPILQENPARKRAQMPDEADQDSPATAARPLPAAARRALAEAVARRAAIDAHAAEVAGPREINGRGGLEPVRYDDWEVKGIASDF